jgi:holo-[acyl-carrier protein] synthase
MLIEVPRFRAVLERRGQRFLTRVFSPGEIAYAKNKREGHQNLAARFAAKCAGRAALRASLGRTLSLRALEVTRKKSGEPRLALTPHAGEARMPEVKLSLTHDADFAMASVLAEAEP